MDKKKSMQIVVYVICFILFWNLLDFLYSIFITRTPYRFSMTNDMLLPLSIMVIIQIVQMTAKKK